MPHSPALIQRNPWSQEAHTHAPSEEGAVSTIVRRVSGPHNRLKPTLRKQPQTELAEASEAKLMNAKVIHRPTSNLSLPGPISRLHSTMKLVIARTYSCGIIELVITLEV